MEGVAFAYKFAIENYNYNHLLPYYFGGSYRHRLKH